MVVIMEKFGWTYEDYQEQPYWLIESIKNYLIAEGQVLKKKNERKRR
jgi:hypothetical protein